MLGTSEHLLFAASRGPLLIQASRGCPELAELVSRHKPELDVKLLEHGALLFRGFRISTPMDFQKAVHSMSGNLMNYVYRSTPRTKLLDRVYTATEYPASETIALHNENSYQREWPRRLAFCCLTPSQTGGETTLADVRRVTNAIGPKIVENFESRQVCYVRHYTPHVDLSWQTVFQTDDRLSVAEFCRTHSIESEWLDADTLRTVQISQGTAIHPITCERLFFNQAHLFHVTNLGQDSAKDLLHFFGPDRLPRQAYYGDGCPIEFDVLEHVRSCFQKEALPIRWHASDVLLIDNMQIAHGRRSYTGARRVLAALMDPCPQANSR